MAVTTIAHKPDLTKEQVQEIFRKHFEGKYSVEKVSRPLRDFVVVKNPFVGVDVKLQQGGNETKFVYSGLAPHLLARLLLGGLIGFVFWRSLTNEVREFIESAPEFK
jgi:hypothetical protein